MKSKAIRMTAFAAARSEVLGAALLAAMVGGVMLFAVGFAHSATVHNAAHDTRHTIAFPCH